MIIIIKKVLIKCFPPTSLSAKGKPPCPGVASFLINATPAPGSFVRDSLDQNSYVKFLN